MPHFLPFYTVLDPSQRLLLPISVCSQGKTMTTCHPEQALDPRRVWSLFEILVDSHCLSFTPSTLAGAPTFQGHSLWVPGSNNLSVSQDLPSLCRPSPLLTQVRCPFIDLITFCIALIPISVFASLFQVKTKSSITLVKSSHSFHTVSQRKHQLG